MDVLDQLTERSTCGICGRLVSFSDDFCSSCRRPKPAVKHHVTVHPVGRVVELACICGWTATTPRVGRRVPTRREAFDLHVLAASA